MTGWNRRRVATALLAISLLLAPSGSQAGTITKANNATSLDQIGSWVGGVVPGAGDIALWDSTVTAANTVALGSDQGWGGLQVINPGGAVTISAGSALSLGSSGIDLLSATQNLTLSAATALTADQAWGVASGRTLTVGGIVSGASQLTKSGTGLLVLSGANTLAGKIVVDAGTLNVGNAAALGAVQNDIEVKSGATVNINGVNINLRGYDITIAGTGVGGAGAIVNNSTSQSNGFGTVTLAGDAAIGGTGRWDIRPITAGDARLNLGGYTLTKTGTNLVSLVDGTLSQDGTININQGTLAFTRFQVSGAGSINVANSATLLLESSTGTFSKAVALAGGSTLRVISSSATLGSPITLGGTATFDVQNTLTANGEIGGAGGLTKTNSGTLVLTGANSYAGATTVSGGVLRGDLGAHVPSATVLTLSGGAFESALDAVRPLGSGAGQTQITGGASGFSAFGGAIKAGFGTIASPASLVWGQSGFAPTTFILNSAAANNAIEFINPIDLNNGAGAVTRTIQVGASTALLSGSLTQSGTGAAGLTKSGAGTLVLSGTSTYTGATTVSAGTLRGDLGSQVPSGTVLTLSGGVFESALDAVRPLGSGAGQTQITGGASGFSAFGGAVKAGFGTIASPTPLVWGQATFAPTTFILNSTAANNVVEFINPIDLNNGATAVTRTIQVGASTALLSGGLTQSGAGAAALTKTGSGTLMLGAANSYSGATTVSTGLLGLAHPLAIQYSALSLSNGTGLVLRSDADTAFSMTSLTWSNSVSVDVGAISAGPTGKTLTLPNVYLNGSGTYTITNASGDGYKLALGEVNAVNTQPNFSSDVDLSIARLYASSVTRDNPYTFSGAGNITVGPIEKAATQNVSLVKSGSGTLLLNGANTYTGATTINAGTVKLGTGSAFGDASTVTMGGGKLDLAGFTETIGLLGGTISGAGGVIDSVGGGKLILTGASNTLTANGTGAVISAAVQMTGGTAATRTFSVSGASDVLTISGPLSEGTAGASLTKAGSGTLLLSGDNSYTGTTTLTAGTLALGHDNALGLGTALTLSGGTLAASGAARTVTQAVTLNGNAAAAGSYDLSLGGTLTNSGGNRTLTSSLDAGKTLTLSAINLSNDDTARTLTIGGAGDTEVTGAIGNGGAGAGGLTKAGAGTLLLSGASTYTGATTVSAGTLRMGAHNAIVSGVTLNGAGATLDLADAYNLSLPSLAVSGGSGTAVTGIGAGRTLRLDGAGSTLLVNSSTFSASGPGTLAIDNAAGTVCLGNGNTTTADFSGLGELTANVSQFDIGVNVNGGNPVSVKLAPSTAITTPAFHVSRAPNNTGGLASTVTLGEQTVLNADTITIASGKANTATTVLFDAAGASPALTVRGQAGGASRANMTLGLYNVATTGNSPYGVLNLSGGSADLRLDTLTLGQIAAAGNGTHGGRGEFTLGAGTVDVNTVVVGESTAGASTSTSQTWGVLNLNGGTMRVNSSFVIGQKNGTTSPTGTVNLNGGRLIAGGPIVGGSLQGTVFNFNGGTLQAGLSSDAFLDGLGQVQVRAGGAVIDTAGHDIGLGRSLLADPASPGGGLTKQGAGRLTISRNSTFTGPTVIEAGTLALVAGSGSIPEGAVSFWRLQEGVGTTLTNDVAGRPAGSIAGSAPWVAGPGLPGSGSYGVQLNGSSQLLQFGTDSTLDAVDSAFTVSTWFKTTSTGAFYRSLFSKYGDSGITNFWGLGYINTSQVGFMIRNSGGTAASVSLASGTALDNQWHHLVGVRDGAGQILLYLDGTLYGQAGDAIGLIANTRPIQSGRHQTQYIATSIAGSGVWDRPLTADEVASLYQFGLNPIGGSLEASSEIDIRAGAALDVTGLPGARLALNNQTLKGAGTVIGTIGGTGLVSPGASPGVLTMDAVDPSGGLDFAFEFTRTGAPDFANPASSGNDAVRLTALTNPILSPMTLQNEISVYFDVENLLAGGQYGGGFFTEQPADLLAMLGGAAFSYYVRGDGAGTHPFGGQNYYALAEYGPDWSIILSARPYAVDNLNGQLLVLEAQGPALESDIPEPASMALLASGLAGLGAYIRRRRSSR